MMNERDFNELYSNPSVQDLVSNLPSTSVLVPSFDSMEGKFRYTIAEKFLGENSVEVLDELSQIGLLEKRLYRRELSCPECQKPNLAIVYNCDTCKSDNIEEKELLTHSSCGKSNYADEFYSNESKTAHRECKSKVDQSNLKHGVSRACGNCGEKVKIKVSYLCRSCDNEGTTKYKHDQLKFTDIFSYSINEKAVGRDLRAVFDARKILVKNGYQTSIPGRIKGKNDIEYSYPIVATRGDDTIALEILPPSETSNPDEVYRVFARSAGMNNDVILLSTSMEEQHRKFLAMSRIEVANGDNFENALKYFDKILQNREKLQKS